MKEKYFKAGTFTTHFYDKTYAYESFTPSLINKQFEWRDKKIDVFLEEGGRLLGVSLGLRIRSYIFGCM